MGDVSDCPDCQYHSKSSASGRSVTTTNNGDGLVGHARHCSPAFDPAESVFLSLSLFRKLVHKREPAHTHNCETARLRIGLERQLCSPAERPRVLVANADLLVSRCSRGRRLNV